MDNYVTVQVSVVLPWVKNKGKPFRHSQGISRLLVTAVVRSFYTFYRAVSGNQHPIESDLYIYHPLASLPYA